MGVGLYTFLRYPCESVEKLLQIGDNSDRIVGIAYKELKRI